MSDPITFLTPEAFMTAIESMIADRQISYIEAILGFCDDNDLEYADIVPVIKGSMREKIRVDDMKSGYFKQESTLPI